MKAGSGLINFVHNPLAKILINFTEHINRMFQKQFSYLKKPYNFKAYICHGNTNHNLTRV